MEVRTSILGPEGDDGLTPIEREVVTQSRKTIEMTLSNGRKVKFQKPAGAVSMKVARLLDAESRNEMLNIY